VFDDAVGNAFGFCVAFAQADVSELGVGEQAIGDQPPARGARAAVEVVQDGAD
jgi:hypothetical protein